MFLTLLSTCSLLLLLLVPMLLSTEPEHARVDGNVFACLRELDERASDSKLRRSRTQSERHVLPPVSPFKLCPASASVSAWEVATASQRHQLPVIELKRWEWAF